MEMIRVEDAVGMILAHDMTEILPGVSKKAAFKRGHVIQEKDIDRLLKMGKEHIGILKICSDDIHEDEAALIMAKAAIGSGIELTLPSEGKVRMIAKDDGLLKVNVTALQDINNLEDIMLATLHTNMLVKKGTEIGGTRIIPLITSIKNIEMMEEISNSNKPIIEIKPLRKLKAGIITTGSEVYYKRIPDKFGPVIKDKLNEMECEVINQVFVNDDADMIARAINNLISEGAEFITCTGGMSVDPDDVTPLGIKKSGAKVIAYGAPVLPGAMFMLAYLGEEPIVGLPGCVMYAKRTIFDLMLPRILAGDNITKSEINSLGHGGICQRCEICTFPICGFGKSGL